MNHRSPSVVVAAVTVLALAPVPARACNVPAFVTGRSLPYHTYLASHPATLLIYADPARPAGTAADEALYAGLQEAGHALIVVRERETLRSALERRNFDLVIAAFGANGEIAGQVAAEAPGAAVLPVVARSRRKAPALRERFDDFVIDGSSLGAYLRAIDRTLARQRP